MVILRCAKAPQGGFAWKACACAEGDGLEAEVGGGVFGGGGSGNAWHFGGATMLRTPPVPGKVEVCVALGFPEGASWVFAGVIVLAGQLEGFHPGRKALQGGGGPTAAGRERVGKLALRS